jgi:hypothetical protein
MIWSDTDTAATGGGVVCAPRADVRSGTPESRPPLAERRSGERVTEAAAREAHTTTGPPVAALGRIIPNHDGPFS